MEFPVPATFLCNVQLLSGQSTIVEALPSWTTSDLRKHLESKLKIPVYEQEFICACVRLSATCVLADLPYEAQGTCLELTLCRTLKPDCISGYEAKCMWRSFLRRSGDNGLTVEGKHASKILRSAALFRVDSMIKSKADLPTSFTFPELLMYVSSLKESLPPCSPVLFNDEEMYLRFCRPFSQARRSAANEWSELFDEIRSEAADDEENDRHHRLPARPCLISL
eukprot:TRINITY_DN6350_c2_g1_i1.p1 TRINITY_DN6350_c2_g1~~TRINITY_DN6350_c2_g1_i1.p1  ORF type:complete len:224 (+),score=46.16 TRINITY_DN6350_c2_g1_i1:49-720(+)